MTWTWNQSNGILSHDGKYVATGYSGHGSGVNNPSMQNVPNVGPLPRGAWTIGEMIPKHPDLGPVVMPLEPDEGTDTFGRGGFFIHGDDVRAPGMEEGSKGCIVLPRVARQAMADSQDNQLEVA